MTDSPKPRRPKGSGTVKQLGPQQWWGQIMLGTKPDGTRNLKSVYGRSEEGVNKQLADLKRRHDAGADLDAGNLTLAEWFDEWLAYKAAMNANAPRTLESYRAEIARHIAPAIGDIRLAKLQTRHVKRMLIAGREKGLSLRTVQYHRSILHAALEHAVAVGAVPTNAAHAAERPKLPRKRFQVLSLDEAEAFLTALRGDRLEAFWTLALTCGLRQGVLMGLRWRDLDLELGKGLPCTVPAVTCKPFPSGTLAITGQLQRVNGVVTRVERETSKLKFATLTLPPFVVATLGRHRERQAFEVKRAGERWDDHDLVFCTPIGTPLDRANVGKALRATLAAAGLPALRPHDLRHTASTLLAARGVPPKDIQTLLGHASLSMTEYYTHETEEGRDRVAQAMDELFGDR
jgi:integrase